MTKNVFREIIITLLICIVIIIILAIIFYSYNPLNKVVPNKIAYTTPDEIKSEIAEENADDILQDGYNVTYKVEDADLDKYTKSNRYIPGKAHPFGASEASIGTNVDAELDIPELEGSGGVSSNPARLQGVETTNTSSTQSSGLNTTATVGSTGTSSSTSTTNSTSSTSSTVQSQPTPVKPK